MSDFNWPLMQNTITWSDRIKMTKFILTTDKYTQGKMVSEFEKKWSTWLGVKNSLFVTSGSTANFLLVSSVMEKYKIKSGDKVLLPACTWMTNVAPPIQLGLSPIFCDINLEDYSFDSTMVEKIAKDHPDIKLIFITHLLGIPAPSEYLKSLFPNAIIIDDVCESHGVIGEDNRKVGAANVGSTFSFYFGHHMTTIEGGMVSTNDEELYDLMKMKRSHGMSRNSSNPDHYSSMYPDIEKSFLFITDGYNFRNTELSAVLGISQLTRLDSYIQRRKINHELFCKIISSRKDIFYPVPDTKNNSSFSFPLICRNGKIKQKLIQLLKDKKVEYRPIVGGNLLKQPFITRMNVNIPNCPNADIIHENGVYIGNNQFVDESNMELLKDIVLSI